MTPKSRRAIAAVAVAIAAGILVAARLLWPDVARTTAPEEPPARPIEAETPADTALVVPLRPGPCAMPVLPGPFHRGPVPRLDADLVRLFKGYLDWKADDAYKHRQPLVERLAKDREGGHDVLGDLDTLTSILYAARPFEPAYGRRSMEKADGFHEDEVNRIRSVAIAPTEKGASPVQFSIRLPVDYPDDPKLLSGTAPYPVIVALDESDARQPGVEWAAWPGEEVIRRRYARHGPLEPLLDEWIVLAPAATRDELVTDGKVNVGSILMPLQKAWQRYQFDIDRIVLEGGSAALAMAASQPLWFAGVIVRGDDADVSPDLVPNFAHLPVYVVGRSDGAAARSLMAGGTWPTVGPAEGIPAWIEHVRRVVPKRFHWNVQDPQRHVLAHWINVNEVVKRATERTLDVAVLDTEVDPNTVRIDAEGIANVTVFLNDRVVDLSRPVRLVVNGRQAFPPTTYERKLDNTFQARRFDIRKSLYYGWLYPITIEDVRVAARVDGGVGAQVAPGGTASEEQEAIARILFRKGVQFEKAGDLEAARKCYQRALEQGNTSVKDEAEKRVKQIDSK